MFNSQKNVFWEALLVTIFIFGIGILAGVLLENSRTSQINSLFQKSEVDLLDIKLQNEIYSSENFNCELAVKENLNFADKIYKEAQLLEKYEKASRLTEEMIIQHKKYDLLRTMLLLNSEKIRENCNVDYNEIVYFYVLKPEDLTLKAKQNVFSKALLELKESYGEEILLIPIGVDNKTSSINLILDKYNISNQDLPVIVINEKEKLMSVENLAEIQKYLA